MVIPKKVYMWFCKNTSAVTRGVTKTRLLWLFAFIFDQMVTLIKELIVYFRFYSLWDTGYAKIHIPIIASVSEHQPTTWFSFFFDLHILAPVFPVGMWYCIKNVNDERVFSKFTRVGLIKIKYTLPYVLQKVIMQRIFNIWESPKPQIPP